ncbi:hypothetical protein ABIE91_003029 [Bradyrhizobium elkanii]
MNSADTRRFKDEDDDDVLRGQYHGHPYGELNLVVPLNKWAELKGLQGWQGPGWTAPDPGSRHYPRSEAARLSICSTCRLDASHTISRLPPDHRTAHRQPGGAPRDPVRVGM